MLRKMRFDAYMVFLKEFPEITHLTRWVEIRPVLEEKKDPRFDALDESERRHNFQDLVTELRKVAEAERQEREKEKREKEKANRDAFRECLKQKVAEGVINAGSKWRDMKNDLEKEPVYLAMEGQAGSTTREIFEDVVDELAQLYRADRKVRAGVGVWSSHIEIYEKCSGKGRQGFSKDGEADGDEQGGEPKKLNP